MSCLLLAGCVRAQSSASVGGAVLGYVANAGDVRPLYGIPGAVTWGPAVVSGVDQAVAGPKRDVAIACAGGRVELISLDQPDDRKPLFDGQCSRIAFSPQGRSVVVFDEAAQRLRVVKGLPDAPDTGTEFEWTGPLAALGVTDDADHVLAASEEATLDLSGDGSRTVIANAAVSVALTGRSAWVALRDEDAIVAIDLGAESPAVRNSIPEPASAVALSADGGLLAFVRRDTGALILSRLSDGGRLEPTGSCAAVALAPLGGNAVFRVTTNVGGACILDADREQPRIFILPGAAQ